MAASSGECDIAILHHPANIDVWSRSISKLSKGLFQLFFYNLFGCLTEFEEKGEKSFQKLYLRIVKNFFLSEDFEVFANAF